MARNNEMTNMAEIVSVMEVRNVFKNQSFCITGHLGNPRANIEDIIRQAGGTVEKKVSYTTTYLITNEDWTAGSVKTVSSKYHDAKLFGTKIISESKFFDMITRDERV